VVHRCFLHRHRNRDRPVGKQTTLERHEGLANTPFVPLETFSSIVRLPMSNPMANPSINTTAPIFSSFGVRRLTFVVSGSFALVSIVIGSCVLRAIGSTARVAPTLFPDEYIYTALARSLAQSGRPLIRGGSAHFPALLAPILAAPVWAVVSSTTAAYHVVQAENALFMSLAAVPVYLIARWLGFSQSYALFSALVAVAIPDLTYSGYMLAEPVAYPIALTALYLGMRALERPTLVRQAAFLATAGAASFARVQYIVLVPAFLVAAALISRRRTLRAHTLPFALLGLGLVAVTALGSANALGYYSAVTSLHVGLGLIHWMIIDGLLLTLAAGVAIVPGAVVGFASARGPREISCAVLSGTYALALFGAAALYASNGSARFQERYLFSLLPLLPIGFGLYVRHSKRGKWPITLAAASGIALAALVPISPYVEGAGVTDSPTLRAVARIEATYGVGATSLGLALYVTFAAATAACFAWRRGAWPILAVTLAFLIISSAAASSFDATDSRSALESTTAVDPRWVDEHQLTDVTAIRTRSAATPGPLLELMVFNRSITREAVLSAASPTDSFVTSTVQIAPSGALVSHGAALRSPILLELDGVTAALDNARLIAQTERFGLWKPVGTPRFRYLEQGRYRDGWLAPSGRLTFYATKSHPIRGFVTMTISAASSQKVPFTIAGTRLLLHPGSNRHLRFCVNARQPWSIGFAGPVRFLRGERAVSVRASAPRFVPSATCSPTDLGL
jgi:Dolichyl-phosphate-mannose-protein mannosyltransferase